MADIITPMKEQVSDTIDCSQVDVEEIEQMGIELVKNVENFAMNIDISNIQFDPHQMYENAKKLGLDAGDLQEYGFEAKGKCSNMSCLNRDKIKNFADYLDNVGKLEGNMMKKGK